MATAAETLYGSTDAPSQASTPSTALAEQRELAGRFYDKPTVETKTDASKFWDNDTAVERNAIRERVESQVDAGLIDPGQADDIVAGLSREVEALGLEDEPYIVRELMRPADADAGRARGASNRWLREQYGERAPQVLQAANRWLQGKAPAVARMLSLSRAGNDLTAIRSVIRAYEKSTRASR